MLLLLNHEQNTCMHAAVTQVASEMKRNFAMRTQPRTYTLQNGAADQLKLNTIADGIMAVTHAPFSECIWGTREESERKEHQDILLRVLSIRLGPKVPAPFL